MFGGVAVNGEVAVTERDGEGVVAPECSGENLPDELFARDHRKPLCFPAETVACALILGGN